MVPFTRGKERSRTSDSVLAEARQMADLGYTEIQLLGQNVNSYKDPAGKPGGRFSRNKKTFAELLAAVGEVPGIRRVRFTTSRPRDFGRNIIEAIDAVPTLCDHVHLPVQSGSDRVLNAMQRLYTREQYMERIAWMKAARREISITSDVIVGFPGETEEDFARDVVPCWTKSARLRLHLQIFSASKHSIASPGGCHPRTRKKPAVWRF